MTSCFSGLVQALLFVAASGQAPSPCCGIVNFDVSPAIFSDFDNLDWGQRLSIFPKLHVRQLRLGFLHRNLALAVWHLGILRQLHTKHRFDFGIPIMKLTSVVENVQKTAARWTCRQWRNTRSIGDMQDKLEWPSLESCSLERSSLTFFYKIHSIQCLLIKTNT